MNTIEVQVRSREPQADAICSFELAHPHGLQLPAFTAGAHIDVHIAPGLVRQYSLCGDPAERHRWRIAVLREPASRGGSAALHARLLPGATLQVSAPRNHFPLADAPRSLLIAGGIGITPLLSMAQALHAGGRDFQLHYAARSAARMAFRREIEAAAWADRAQLHLGDGPADQRFDAARALGAGRPDTHVYVCGPAGFMDSVLDAAGALGWPAAQLHRELFAGAAVASGQDSAFEIELARSGLRCAVPSGRTVLQVLLEHGIDVPFSCESGVCGTCLTPVLQGEPEHRDSFLTDAERAANSQFTPCCSRARTPRLVLDL